MARKKPRDLADSRYLDNYANSVDFNFSPIRPIEHGSLSRIISIDFPIRESQFESSTLLFSTIVLHIPRAFYEEKQFTVIENGNVGIGRCDVKIQVQSIKRIGTFFLICEAKENDEKKRDSLVTERQSSKSHRKVKLISKGSFNL